MKNLPSENRRTRADYYTSEKLRWRRGASAMAKDTRPMRDALNLLELNVTKPNENYEKA